MPAHLLAVSDLHLGRRPSRLPDDLSALGLDHAELTPAAAWRGAVRAAIERDVDAVLLAGDVVESLKDRFRALEILESGVRRLLEHGISVLAVAGNHDVVALPRLADLMDGAGGEAAPPGAPLGRSRPAFRLIGRGGTWECVELEARDGTRVRVVGWSFTGGKERDNPLASLPPLGASATATVGLLHCDVDGGQSPYAPVPLAQLASAPVDAWLLGHVHAPGALAAPRPIGYLGSLVGLDPGEHGERGAWLFRVEGPGAVAPVRLHVAPLRWERVDLPVDALEDAPPEAVEEGLDPLVRDALARVRAELDSTLGETRLVGCRIRLTGRLRHHAALARLVEAGPWRELVVTIDGVTLFVESLVDDAAAAADLAELARSDDPPGLLARLILELDGDTPAAGELLSRARRALRRQDDAGAWQRAGVELPPPDERRLLLAAGRAALDALLAQQDEGGAR